MLNPFNRKKNKDNTISQENLQEAKVENTEENINNKKLKNYVDIKRKDLLRNNGINTEEIKKEVIKALEEQRNNKKEANPFKVREDIMISILNNQWRPLERLPFQKVKIKGEEFYLNYTYKDMRIKINYLFYRPQLEIDIAEEIRKKHVTRRKLDELNSFINEIEQKRNEGVEDAEKIDLKDFIYEKEKLKSILDTVKGGRKVYFSRINPVTLKEEYEVIHTNDGIKWVVRDELGNMRADSSSKVAVLGKILEDVEKVLNLNVSTTYKGIITAALILLAIIINSIMAWHVVTFDEQLIDKRVNEQLESAVDLACQGYQSEANTLERFIMNNGLTPPTINNPNLNQFEEVR